jgi:hypothetical protein
VSRWLCIRKTRTTSSFAESRRRWSHQAKHYGAVLNLDFDYAKYLDTLSADGLNLTRTFSGSYAEPQGAFNIADNTLAPKAGRFICPWARSGEPGYANGGNKFDLTKWDDAYFKRLKDFGSLADKRGVVVELNLFCPMYEDKAVVPQPDECGKQREWRRSHWPKTTSTHLIRMAACSPSRKPWAQDCRGITRRG